jgi:hypothetical protein
LDQLADCRCGSDYRQGERGPLEPSTAGVEPFSRPAQVANRAQDENSEKRIALVQWHSG